MIFFNGRRTFLPVTMRSVFFVCILFMAVAKVFGDDDSNCNQEKECHFGEIYDKIITRGTSVDGSLRTAVMRFSTVPRGCANYFSDMVELRNKIATHKDKTHTYKSRCDSSRVFDKYDIFVSYFTLIIVSSQITAFLFLFYKNIEYYD